MAGRGGVVALKAAKANPPMLETPVAFFVFNRPDVTARVLERIAEVQPKTLFVVADGPRPDHPHDKEKCQAVREIVSQINWPAQVFTNCSDENMGCGPRVSSGLSWIFDHVEEAIILEDDCLPSVGFFSYCEELLERYRHDTRVGIISGNNFVYPKIKTDYSYYFSRYPHIWGWATWRRSWEKYDFESFAALPLAEALDVLEQVFFGNRRRVGFWMDRLTEPGGTSAPGTRALSLHEPHAILAQYPSRREISLPISVWTRMRPTLIRRCSEFRVCRHTSRTSPLRHPPFVVRNAIADQRTDEKVFKINRPSRFRKILSRCIPRGRRVHRV